MLTFLLGASMISFGTSSIASADSLFFEAVRTHNRKLLVDYIKREPFPSDDVARRAVLGCDIHEMALLLTRYPQLASYRAFSRNVPILLLATNYIGYNPPTERVLSLARLFAVAGGDVDARPYFNFAPEGYGANVGLLETSKEWGKSFTGEIKDIVSASRFRMSRFHSYTNVVIRRQNGDRAQNKAEDENAVVGADRKSLIRALLENRPFDSNDVLRNSDIRGLALALIASPEIFAKNGAWSFPLKGRSFTDVLSRIELLAVAGCDLSCFAHTRLNISKGKALSDAVESTFPGRGAEVRDLEEALALRGKS